MTLELGGGTVEEGFDQRWRWIQKSMALALE